MTKNEARFTLNTPFKWRPNPGTKEDPRWAEGLDYVFHVVGGNAKGLRAAQAQGKPQNADHGGQVARVQIHAGGDRPSAGTGQGQITTPNPRLRKKIQLAFLFWRRV